MKPRIFILALLVISLSCNLMLAEHSVAIPPIEGWSQDVPLPLPINNHGVAALEDGIFYFGGYSDKSYLYQPGIGAISIADLPEERHNMGYVLHQGKVYSIAGYRPETGGYDPDWFRTKDVWSYDPVSNSWHTEASLTYARDSVGAASLGDYIYVVGGHHEAVQAGTSISLVERYNPDNPSLGWQSVAPLNQDRQLLGAVAVGGKIYAIGGFEYHYPGPGYIGDWVEIYDPQTNTWTFGPPMPTGRLDFAIVLVANRYIYVIGGTTNEGITGSVEYYDTLEGAWHVDTPIPVAMRSLRAAAIDGRIYVLGGYSASGPMDTVYVSVPQNPPALISLNPGWNLISFPANKCFYQEAEPDDQPTCVEKINVNSLGFNTLSAWLDSVIMPKNAWRMVIGVNGAMARYLSPEFNSLKSISPCSGYWVKIAEGFEDVTLSTGGVPFDLSCPILLKEGWNLVGCPINRGYYDGETHPVLPWIVNWQKVDVPVAYHVFGSIDGKYSMIIGTYGVYNPNSPPAFSSLHYIAGGFGYWIKVDESSELLYPLDPMP